MASGSTFGPSPVTFEGRIIGAIAMIVGSTLTGIYVSIITVWYITRKIIVNKGDLSHETKQMIISKINGLENLSSNDLKQLLLLIESFHENLQKSRNG